MRTQHLLFTILVMCGLSTARADLLKDFDTLGGNDVLLDRAKALNPESSIRVVQDRIVDRRMREEFTVEYGNVLGGDAYLHTQTLGANYNLHLTPHWSLGAKYGYSFNALRGEAEHLIHDTSITGRGIIPQIDYPKQTYMGVVDWYPIYGKMNLYDLGVFHFDIYLLGGYGRVQLKSGSTDTYTVGGGMGLWLSRYLTSRLEMRYQGYQAGRSAMNLTVASLQLGLLHDLF